MVQNIDHEKNSKEDNDDVDALLSRLREELDPEFDEDEYRKLVEERAERVALDLIHTNNPIGDDPSLEGRLKEETAGICISDYAAPIHYNTYKPDIFEGDIQDNPVSALGRACFLQDIDEEARKLRTKYKDNPRDDQVVSMEEVIDRVINHFPNVMEIHIKHPPHGRTDSFEVIVHTREAESEEDYLGDEVFPERHAKVWAGNREFVLPFSVRATSGETGHLRSLHGTIIYRDSSVIGFQPLKLECGKEFLRDKLTVISKMG
jgi:hypothetical protein